MSKTIVTLSAFLAVAGLTACQSTTQTHMQTSAEANASTHAKTHTLNSPYDFDQTVARLIDAISSKNMTIFTVIDHSEAAKQAGLSMQPAKVIVFGAPKAGTPLMQKDPIFALQLPLKVLVTEVNGEVLVSFADTRALIEGSQIAYSDVANTLANAEKLLEKTLTP